MERVAELRGGQKAMWLRQHRNLVVEFYNEFGEDETKQRFCFTHDTLEGLLKYERRSFQPKFSTADKALLTAQIAEEGVRQCRREIEELKESYALFKESVSEQIGKKIIFSILESGIRVDETLLVKPKQDRLSLEGGKR